CGLWRVHDVFVVPSWTWHYHEADAKSVLFSYSDRPGAAETRFVARTARSTQGQISAGRGHRMTSEELERRVTVLEDIEAIKKLKARYCSVCDDNHNPDMITTLFAEDGIWEGADQGAHRGHAAIRKLFESFRDRIS